MALQDDINNFSASNTALDLLLLAAETANTTNNRIISVTNLDALPNLASNTIISGTIFFVDSAKTFVVAQNGSWTGLDNCRVRFDYSDRLLYGWGCFVYGKIGENCTTIGASGVLYSPKLTGGCFTDWCQVSAGLSHSLALRTNGTAWSWGLQTAGYLGNNESDGSKASPVSVVGGFTDWRQVSAGCGFNLALRTNGTVWAWGVNARGELGDNTTTSKSSPVSVVGGFTDWCQVSAGWCHAVALRTNGTAWAWGRNNYGQLGDNTTTSRSSPVSVVGGFTDWCQITSGDSHTIAIRTGGTAWAWGGSFCGELGDNTVTSKLSPVSVVGGFTDWCQVSAGRYHNIAIKTDGTAWAWGDNRCGQLGDNTITCRSSPVSVVGGFTDWCQVSAAYCVSFALRTNGTIWSFGYNGMLGNGDNTYANRSSPVSLFGSRNDWVQVKGGPSARHAFAIRATKS